MNKKLSFILRFKRPFTMLFAGAGLLAWLIIARPDNGLAAAYSTPPFRVDAEPVLTTTVSVFMPLVVANSVGAISEDRAVAAWQAKTFYAVGAQVTYNGNPYKCLQAHTAQIGWEPATTPAL